MPHPATSGKRGFALKIGIYGGTFHPIHLGHMAAAEFAAKQLHFDRLYLIPTGDPPHKELGANDVGALHRLEMAAIAAETFPCEAEALDLEVRRAGKSFTLDTLRELKKRFPKDRLYFLMGTDMFLTFHKWKNPEKIAKLCTLCAFDRRADSHGMLENQRQSLKKELGASVEVLTLPHVLDISSTQVRSILARGLAGGAGEARAYLDPQVYGYILREGLYGTGADLKQLSLEDLRCAALSMLRHRRVPHVLGTEEEAARLALRWGVDEASARRAALLHDCTKKCGREQHLALCRQYGIRLDAEEQKDEKLLHALTGAAVARHVYGLSQPEVSAIRWHTTGKADMTALEKIIYLADYIEPTRSFCDLTELRSLAYKDLDRAVLLGLTMSVEELEARGARVHANSVYARDYLKGKLT